MKTAEEWLKKKLNQKKLSILASETTVIEWMEEYAKSSHPAQGNQSLFKMPTDKQLIDIAILFNEGKLEAEKLADMVGMCQFILDRLEENNDVTIASSIEK